jgi:hypothetical protein
MTRSARSGPGRNTRVRCAIYTRKSSEKGLDQEFNSLQAEREACEAFITTSATKAGCACVRVMTTAGSPVRRWVGRLCSGCSPTSRQGGSISWLSTRLTG